MVVLGHTFVYLNRHLVIGQQKENPASSQSALRDRDFYGDELLRIRGPECLQMVKKEPQIEESIESF